MQIDVTKAELKLIYEALDELIYELEHYATPPSKRPGEPKKNPPDTTELRALFEKIEKLKQSE